MDYLFRITLLFLGLVSVNSVQAQNLSELNVLEVFDEKISKDKAGLYASNSAHCPLTLIVDFPEKKGIEVNKNQHFLQSRMRNKKVQFCNPCRLNSFSGSDLFFLHRQGLHLGHTM